MPKEPYSVSATASFRLKAKDVTKKHRLLIAGAQMKVVSNRKNNYGDRILTLTPPFGKRALVTLILPADVKLIATIHKHKHFPKNR